MKYYDYINSVVPNEKLKNKTRIQIQNEIQRQNLIVKKRKTILVSIAACFILLVVSLSVSKKANMNIPFSPEITDNSNTSQDNSNKISISIDNDDKYGPQIITFNGNEYWQYCDSSKKAGWGEDNGNIEIDKADIGALMFSLNENNMINYFNENKNIKENHFYAAEIYQYLECKNNTILLGKTADKYYMFILRTIGKKQSVSEVLDLYTLSNSNPIKCIKVSQQDEVDPHTENYIEKTTITDINKINSIIEILEKCNDNYKLEEIISKGFIKKELSNENYKLDIIFEDQTETSVFIQKNYFQLGVNQIDDYGYYLLSDLYYEQIINSFNI